MIYSPLKWVGGKGRVTNFILEHAPKSFSNYHESFVGSGSVFLAVKQMIGGSREWHISDTNPHLICWWKTIQSKVDEMLVELCDIRATYESGERKENYHALRKEFNERIELDVRKAALFMFLCRTAFNGLVRYNSKGHFNSAWGNQTGGQHQNSFVFDSEHLIALSKILDSSVFIKHASYEETNCENGDFAFFDPPYVALGERKIDALSYSKNGFTDKDQIEFANWCQTKRSNYLMICNHDTEFVRNCFGNFNFLSYDLMKSFSGSSSSRKKTKEIIIKNF